MLSILLYKHPGRQAHGNGQLGGGTLEQVHIHLVASHFNILRGIPEADLLVEDPLESLFQASWDSDDLDIYRVGLNGAVTVFGEEAPPPQDRRRWLPLAAAIAAVLLFAAIAGSLMGEGTPVEATSTSTTAPDLAGGTTYYWRVDEVNGAPDNTVFTGDIWSFSVEPFAYPVENVVATSNGVSGDDAGIENIVNGSGLDADDQHSTASPDMWLATPCADPL